mmetsp:Transcript_35262/g.51812  ORF Transcript_35262/g.51812 Transcript_35262/m.51812 type:complete len:276 (+) Transcript_35262:95-922(+)|eukprot:CAMPEP_0195518816 /NCGR_PEP_ID=MMETSP0794_2-20130614/13718_1 /TAXON_ID=515487 /ORGANISM="Stephanopyxis turris, Strain CCMP 815" /LENGTH=275 /DNA_ID=CAMNT_0040647845 /DNA_START=95 /DNA_END=922 /DNA_ORIENTATION=+
MSDPPPEQVTSDQNRVLGTVKWFSNKKCFGFITPDEDSSITEDVFVHQSSIHSTAFRTLREGWKVEFTVGNDDSGRAKAEHVTSPGGGTVSGPKKEEGAKEGQQSTRPRRRRKEKNQTEEGEKAPPVKRTFWHHELAEPVQKMLTSKGISTNSGTIDVSIGQARVKLGTGGYSSMAHSDGIVAEGIFDCTPEGNATFQWDRSIAFQGGEWKTSDPKSPLLVSSLSLVDDKVIAVESTETAETLWGDDPTDPRSTLETNGFLMRRIVLTARASRRS